MQIINIFLVNKTILLLLYSHVIIMLPQVYDQLRAIGADSAEAKARRILAVSNNY